MDNKASGTEMASPRLFDCQGRVNLQTTRLCDRQAFDAIIDSASVAALCSAIVAARQQMEQGEMNAKDYDALKNAKKRALPSFIFGGHSATGKRKNEDMQSSGLALMDIDHMYGSPQELYKGMIKGREAELGIVAVHMSPSGQGMHIVYELTGGETRAEANERIFSELGLDKDERLPEGYDKGVKDIARCSFAVPRDYFLYIDYDKLFKRTDNMTENFKTLNKEVMNKTEEKSMINEVKETCKVNEMNDVDSVHDHGEGSIIKEKPESGKAIVKPAAIQDDMTLEQALRIFDRACSEISKMDPKGIDAEGHRHNNLLAILSTGICKTVPQEQMVKVVAERMPSYAEEADCQSLINDFYGKYLEANRQLSWQLAKIRAGVLSHTSQAAANDADEDDVDDGEWWGKQQELAPAITPLLPRALADTLFDVPDGNKMAVLCAVLPAAGAYASKVSAEYNDGATHKLGLMAAIVGDFASGKSLCTRRIKPWIKKMEEYTDIAFKKTNEYKEHQNTRRANDKGMKRPHDLALLIPFNSSQAEILRRLKDAEAVDRTLFSYTSEISEVINSHQKGAWAQMGTAWKKGYDADKWGVSYAGSESQSIITTVRYNWTITGTRRKINEFFSNDEVEDGLVSRVIFSEVPSTFDLPAAVHELPEENVKHIEDAVETLWDANGLIELPRTREALRKWLVEKLAKAKEHNDVVIKGFAMRSGSTGFRIAMIAHLLTGEESDNVVDFGVLMAEYVFRGLMHFFWRGYHATQGQELMPHKRMGKRKQLLAQLPPTFTSADIRNASPDITDTNLRTTVSSWVTTNKVKKIDNETWRKTAPDNLCMFMFCYSHGITESLSR